MNFRTFVFVALLAFGPSFTGLCMENDRLDRDERSRVGHLYSKVIRNKEVQNARADYEASAKRYHDVLREAMIKRDPKVESALKKIKRNPGLLAEAIWEKRNNDVLNNLHLPVQRLEDGERKVWNRAMGQLREKEMTKAFGKRLKDNYYAQAKLRKKQINIMRDFKNEAKRSLVEIDGRVKPILDKLMTNAAPKQVPENSGAAEAATEEVDSATVIPMPMPSEEDEC
ncbi:hypothetical protein N9V94_00160 [bacterium]|jgi:hypothetical protein|nr:hypothetical protein [bacterium]